MRKVWIVLLAIGLLVHCSPEGEDIIINTDGKGTGGGTTGSGIDPGKAASTCYPSFQDLELNVATWNIENFSTTNTDLNKVATIVRNLDADIIAVQEVRSSAALFAIAELVPGWEAAFMDIGGSLDLGYLYKKEAFTQVSTLSTAFPGLIRPAAVLTATHASGIEVTFFNIHLKCCSDGISQRQQASVEMKTYLDQNYASQAIILLGDFNDLIDNAQTSPFGNFMNDLDDYRFADQAIAVGSSSNWSYPSWPSHIDHILISNELFEELGAVQTLRPESCVSGYSSDVSDHRPVLASFK